MTSDSRETIQRAAVREFAAKGFSGARMESIARRAGINKAMLFYYFSSKANLYKTILTQALTELFGEIATVLNADLTAALFFEKYPEIFIRFFARHEDYIRVIGFDLIQNPDNITGAIRQIIDEPPFVKLRPQLLKKMIAWRLRGEINEPDPRQVMMNLVALSLFSFIGLPMIETFSGRKIIKNDKFYSQRIRSVVNLLKRGMLK